MSKTICFFNNGAFDKRSFTMMGVSAKPIDGAVGFFGTGFKYAIAVLLRHGCSISVSVRDDAGENGYTQYTFSTIGDTFRDKDIEVIRCESQDGILEMPYTTHFGINWKLWQAYRELYTNCVLDERGGVRVVDEDYQDDVGGVADVSIFVSGDEFVKVHEQHNKYFIPADVPTLCASVDMRAVPRVENSDNVIYYKTMYSGTQMEKETYFTYDYISTQRLTEDRTIADTWCIRNEITDLWYNHMSRDMLIDSLPHVAKNHWYESGLSASNWGCGEAFKSACKYLIANHIPIPMWAMETYTHTLPFGQQINKYKLDDYHKTLLDRAIRVMKHLDMIVDRKLVCPCVSLPNEVLGLYRDGKMYIAKGAFDRGFTCLLGTLYEEWLHHTSKCEDLTREMQNKLVDRIATLMERIYTVDKGF